MASSPWKKLASACLPCAKGRILQGRGRSKPDSRECGALEGQTCAGHERSGPLRNNAAAQSRAERRPAATAAPSGPAGSVVRVRRGCASSAPARFLGGRFLCPLVPCRGGRRWGTVCPNACRYGRVRDGSPTGARPALVAGLDGLPRQPNGRAGTPRFEVTLG